MSFPNDLHRPVEAGCVIFISFFHRSELEHAFRLVPHQTGCGGAARELFKKVFLSMRNVLVGTQCLRLY